MFFFNYHLPHNLMLTWLNEQCCENKICVTIKRSHLYNQILALIFLCVCKELVANSHYLFYVKMRNVSDISSPHVEIY